MRHVTLRIDEALWERFKALAADTDTTASDHLRWLIEKDVKDYEAIFQPRDPATETPIPQKPMYRAPAAIADLPELEDTEP